MKKMNTIAKMSKDSKIRILFLITFNLEMKAVSRTKMIWRTTFKINLQESSKSRMNLRLD